MTLLILTLCTCLALGVQAQNSSSEWSHPCLRDCTGSPAMTCEYRWRVSWYYSMTQECGNCSEGVLDDCRLPGCVPADGVKRPVLVAGRSLPGQAIEVCQGDHIIVEVTNHVQNGEGISIHWHGIYQKNTPYMDGVSMVTQCPINPYTSFKYDFMADQYGTHWWHGHTGLHRTDGLFGALVVRQSDVANAQKNLYDHDLPEHEILLIDWSHSPSATDFLNEQYSSGILAQPVSILINGLSNLESDPTSNMPRNVFEVQQGQRYRFRIICSAGGIVPMKIWIDGHRLTLIATDGSDVDPVQVDALTVYAGERYDFVLDASESIDNYGFNVKPMNDAVRNYGRAIIRYIGANDTVPADTQNRTGILYQEWNKEASSTVITPSNLRSVETFDLPQNGKRQVYIPYDFSTIDDPRYTAGKPSPQVNDRSFTLRSYPLLSQYNKSRDANQLCEVDDSSYDRCDPKFCICTQVLQVNVDQTVEIVLIDRSTHFTFICTHPFHLHGHAFRILAQEKLGHSTTKEEIIAMDEAGNITRNYNNPPEKDTIGTLSPGYTVLQFVANNPGWWFFHCHIEFHVETGMALVLRVGKQSDLPAKPSNFPKCGDFEAEYTSSGDSEALSRKEKGLIVGNAVLGVLLVLSLVLIGCLYSKYKQAVSSSVSSSVCPDTDMEVRT